jgi:hypothetical protein
MKDHEMRKATTRTATDSIILAQASHALGSLGTALLAGGSLFLSNIILPALPDEGERQGSQNQDGHHRTDGDPDDGARRESGG